MLNTFIQEFREEFMQLPLEEIAYPRSVNGIERYENKSKGVLEMDLMTGEFKHGVKKMFNLRAPIHCKGAILYNHLIRVNKLDNKYQFIQEGDKIKFLHMKEPNIYQSSAISFMTKLPKELELQDSIDYETQFTKSFIDPLRFIVTAVKWKIDDSYGTQGTLEDFFT